MFPLVVDSGGRSGSTMMMALLASSSQVAMDREHPYEHAYYAWMAEWSALADNTEWDHERWNAAALWKLQYEGQGDGLIGPPPWLSRGLWERAGEGELGPQLLGHAWREFSARAVHRTRRDLGTTDVRYHAEKTVSIARLRELSPIPVRGVVLHRDPRDVWLSVQAFDRARGFYGFGRGAGESEEEWFERFLAMQAQRLLGTLDERGRPDSMVLAYEELVSNPEAVAARLSSWLDLDLDPTAPTEDLERHRGHSTSASPEASIGRWQRELEPQRRERFAESMGAKLRELGYEG